MRVRATRCKLTVGTQEGPRPIILSEGPCRTGELATDEAAQLELDLFRAVAEADPDVARQLLLDLHTAYDQIRGALG